MRDHLECDLTWLADLIGTNGSSPTASAAGRTITSRTPSARRRSGEFSSPIGVMKKHSRSNGSAVLIGATLMRGVRLRWGDLAAPIQRASSVCSLRLIQSPASEL
jgi:hypothetical protein